MATSSTDWMDGLTIHQLQNLEIIGVAVEIGTKAGEVFNGSPVQFEVQDIFGLAEAYRVTFERANGAFGRNLRIVVTVDHTGIMDGQVVGDLEDEVA